MPITAAFTVPHPPMIVPAVGGGSEKQIAATTRAYEKAADEIAALKPETIIISSPHAPMYGDYFHISPGSSAEGSFAEFRAPDVYFSEEYDTALVNALTKLAEDRHFPAGTLGAKGGTLDHGTMVPLYFIRQKYKGGRIVRTGLSGLPLREHYRFGQMIAEAGFTPRNKLIVSLSLAMGIGFTASTEAGIWETFPVAVQSIFAQNVVSVIFAVALIMNLALPRHLEE